MDQSQVSEIQLCNDLGKDTPERRNRKEGPGLQMNCGMFLVQRQSVKGSGRNATIKEQVAESLLVHNKGWENGHP